MAEHSDTIEVGLLVRIQLPRNVTLAEAEQQARAILAGTRFMLHEHVMIEATQEVVGVRLVGAS